MTKPSNFPGERRAAASVGRIDDPQVFEDLFEHAPCGYVAMSPDGRIVRSNRLFSEWIGMERQVLVGRRFSELLTIAGKIYYETHLAPLLRMQERFEEVALDLARSGTEALPVLVNAIERRDVDDRPFAIWLTVFKAVDRRRYEAQLLAAREALRGLTEAQVTLIEQAVAARMGVESALRQAQKMEVVGQLTAGLAHDFNNILVGVSGAFDLMERRIQQERGAEVGQYIQTGKEAVRRAIALVARLLAFSRKQEARPIVVDVNAVVTGMEDIIKRALGSPIVLQLSLAADTGMAMSDMNQLESALLNLCVNARDAMEDGGTVTIESTRDVVAAEWAETLSVQPGNYAVLRVVDTGNGMSEEVAKDVLEPFFTTKEADKGTGLGLAMVSEFVRQSLGGIHIASKIGLGTTISLYLPSVDEDG